MNEEELIKTLAKPYLEEIRSSPNLASLLSDVDLLPDQIKRVIDVQRMVAICELFKLCRIPK